MKKITYIVFCCLLISLSACGMEKEFVKEELVEEEIQTQELIELEAIQKVPMNESVDEIEISVWPTYWDTQTVLEELTAIQEEVDDVCYFAAYFDKEQQLFIPEKSLQTKESVEKLFADKQWTSYLTVVNDLLLPAGGSSLKDTKLLYQLLENPDIRTEHIQMLVKLAKENGFDGLEIDYEAIKKDMQLWDYFVAFVTELNEETKRSGIQLRVLFEPGAPIEQLTFPDGPEYVVMCYNLYGYGTEPGPKANGEFIQKMAQKMEVLPGEKKGMAFSVGGFDFYQDGSVAQLTEAQCIELIERYQCEVRRDEESKSVVFEYMDEQGISHQVWYGDVETLRYWIEEGKANGFQHFSIWRLGSFPSIME